jgi:hypothetical protein
MFKWSVICFVSDEGTTYSVVKGVHPEADFVGSRQQCLRYIHSLSEE